MLGPIRLVMVVVSDMERSAAFYRDVLQLPVGFISPQWSEFETGDAKLSLHPAGPHLPVNSHSGISCGFHVDSLEATLAEITSRGGNVVHRSTEQFGELAIIADPDGYGVQLCQLGAES